MLSYGVIVKQFAGSLSRKYGAPLRCMFQGTTPKDNSNVSREQGGIMCHASFTQSGGCMQFTSCVTIRVARCPRVLHLVFIGFHCGGSYVLEYSQLCNKKKSKGGVLLLFSEWHDLHEAFKCLYWVACEASLERNERVKTSVRRGV
jgi:hypothetical protein